MEREGIAASLVGLYMFLTSDSYLKHLCVAVFLPEGVAGVVTVFL